MVYILSSDPARTVMRVRRRQRGSGRRRQRGSGRRRQRGSGRRRQRGSGRRRQRGSGRRRQRGSGFVKNVVQAVASKVLPLAKQAGKYVIREGVMKAPGLLLARNKSDYLKQAIKDTALQGVKHIANNISSGSVGSVGNRINRKKIHPHRLRTVKR